MGAIEALPIMSFLSRGHGVRTLAPSILICLALAAPVAGQGVSTPPGGPDGLASTDPLPSATMAASPSASASMEEAPGRQPAILPERRVHVPASIDATGKTDVSARLQRFVDNTPDQTTIVFPEGSTYRLASGGIKVSGRHDLAFVGHGATLWSIGCTYLDSVFLLGGAGTASSNITIEGLRLRGNNLSPATAKAHRGRCQHQHGIAIYRSRHVEVRDVDIRRTNGDCLYLSGYGERRFRWSEDVWFHDSTCTGTGRMGVAITAGADVVVERSRFTDIAIHVFDIEPSLKRGGARNILFADNTIGTFGFSSRYGGWLLAADGNLAAPVEAVTLRDNVVTDRAIGVSVGIEYHGWDGSRARRDFTIVGNMSMVTAAGPVMDFRHVDGLVVRDNAQHLSTGPLFVVTDSTDVDIQG